MHLLRPALIAVVSLLAACHDAPSSPEPPDPILQGGQLRFAPGHPELAHIGTAAAAPARHVIIELPARIVWNEERTQRIYPAFAGRVARIAADIGQPVKPGNVLAVLASPDFGAAQADAAKAEVDARQTQKTLQRQRELFDAGAIARKELESAEADAARAQAEVQRAGARTRLYGSRANRIDQSLAITAEVAGVVVERNVTPGQELRPDTSGPGTPPLFVVSDPTHLWVQIDAREGEAAALRPGTGFELEVPSLGGEKFKGRIAAMADFIDPATRTIKVRGAIDNPDRRLKAEMLGTAFVERATPVGVLVPARAVSLRGTQHWTMVQVQPGVFEPRDVEIGWQGPRDVLVTRGLRAGERVVSENLLPLARQYSRAIEAARPATPEPQQAAAR